jgi:surface antigen
MVLGKALRMVVALSCLSGVAYLLAGLEPALADCCSCTCYALNKRPDLTDVCTRAPKYWDDDARRHGYTVSRTPRVGAIVVFEAGVQGADWGRDCTKAETGGVDLCSGHVAYVEEVRTPVQFLVSEQGWRQDGPSCDVHSRIAYTGVGVSFIYKPAGDPVGSDANGTAVAQGDHQWGSNQRWRLVADGDAFRIVADHSGACLGVSGGSRANGAKVVLSACHGGDDQRWSLMRVGDDYRVVAKHSGKCLDVSRASLEKGAEIIQWSYHGGSNQLWRLVPQGDHYIILARHSGRSMGVLGDDKPEPVPPVAYRQHWRLVQEGQYYRIVAENNARCLSVSRVLPSDGAPVVLWDPNDEANQLWSFVPQGDYFKIVAKHSGKCLDVSEASFQDGAAVIQWNCNGGDNQLWKVVPDAESFKLEAKHSGKCLSLFGESGYNGAAVIQSQCEGEANGL